MPQKLRKRVQRGLARELPSAACFLQSYLFACEKSRHIIVFSAFPFVFLRVSANGHPGLRLPRVGVDIFMLTEMTFPFRLNVCRSMCCGACRFAIQKGASCLLKQAMLQPKACRFGWQNGTCRKQGCTLMHFSCIFANKGGAQIFYFVFLLVPRFGTRKSYLCGRIDVKPFKIISSMATKNWNNGFHLCFVGVFPNLVFSVPS